MDVTDLVRRLLRRWIASLAVVAVAVVAAGVAFAGAGATYQSTATIVIAPPFLGDSVSEQNPMLNLSDNLAQLAIVLASAMSSPVPPADSGLTEDATAGDGSAVGSDGGQTGGAVGADGGATWTVSTVTGDNPSFARLSPQLVFTVTAPDAGSAEETATALVSEAGARLADLQAEVGTPFQSQARVATVVPPTPGVQAGGSAVRGAAAVGLGVVVLGLLGVLLVDELLGRRRRER
jgi:hypothetical protein